MTDTEAEAGGSFFKVQTPNNLSAVPANSGCHPDSSGTSGDDQAPARSLIDCEATPELRSARGSFWRSQPGVFMRERRRHLSSRFLPPQTSLYNAMQAIIGTELPVAEEVPSELEHPLKLLKDLEVLKHSQEPPERTG